MNETAQIQILQTSPDEDEIHIKDYIAVLKRGWWMIMLSFIVVVGLTILYIIKTPRQYTATAVINCV